MEPNRYVRCDRADCGMSVISKIPSPVEGWYSVGLKRDVCGKYGGCQVRPTNWRDMFFPPKAKNLDTNPAE